MDIYLEEGIEGNGHSGHTVHECPMGHVSVGGTNSCARPFVPTINVYGHGLSVHGGRKWLADWKALGSSAERNAFVARMVVAGLAARPDALPLLLAEAEARGQARGRAAVQDGIKHLLGIY